MEFNALLDALLDEAGMSHAGLAKRINVAGDAHGLCLSYDHTSVARWLRGQRPRDPVSDLVCDILGSHLRRHLTHDEVGLGRTGAHAFAAASVSVVVERASTMWRADDQRRLDVEGMPVLSGIGAIAPVWDWEVPSEDITVSRPGEQPVGADAMDMLRSARTRYEMMYRQAGGVVTRARVVDFLCRQALPILRGRFGDDRGRELYRAAGGIVALAGICAYDSDAHGLAQRYFHQALRLAKASGDRGFGAYVIALLANQALFLADLRLAVAFAEEAANGMESQRLRSRICAVRTRLADVGGQDTVGSVKCLDRYLSVPF